MFFSKNDLLDFKIFWGHLWDTSGRLKKLYFRKKFFDQIMRLGKKLLPKKNQRFCSFSSTYACVKNVAFLYGHYGVCQP